MVKWLVTTMLIMASMNAGASTAQHSHSALEELAAIRLGTGKNALRNFKAKNGTPQLNFWWA